jgi:hypothetical protein
MKLFASEKCWKFKAEHPDIFDSFGCGPGGIGDFLVPDTIYGLSIKPACQVHDWDYRFGEGHSEEERKKADKRFLTNMFLIIDDHGGNFIIMALRRRRAKEYYLAVRWFGAAAYFEERSNDNQFCEFNAAV